MSLSDVLRHIRWEQALRFPGPLIFGLIDLLPLTSPSMTLKAANSGIHFEHLFPRRGEFVPEFIDPWTPYRDTTYTFGLST